MEEIESRLVIVISRDFIYLFIYLFIYFPELADVLLLP